MKKGIAQDKPRLSVLIYGPSGSGKTSSICTLPAAKTLVIAAESQTGQRLARNEYKGEIWTPETWKDLESLHLELKDDKKFQIVVIDSITQVAEICLQEIMDERYPPINGVRKFVKASFAEYAQLKMKLKMFIDSLTGLDKNIIFLARETEKAVLEGKALRVELMITGSLSAEIFGHVLYVFRMVPNSSKGKFTNKLLTMAKPEFYAKGDPLLNESESGKNGTVDLTLAMSKILTNGGKK